MQNYDFLLRFKSEAKKTPEIHPKLWPSTKI